MDTRWRARRLLDSPHRLGFAAAAAVMASSALGWLALQAWPPSAAGGTLAAAAAHGLVFGFGFLPLFFAGFLFTVGPRWVGLPMDDARYRTLARTLRWPLLSAALAWLAWWPVWLIAGATGSAQVASGTLPDPDLHLTPWQRFDAAWLVTLGPPVALLVVAMSAWSLTVVRLAGLVLRGAPRASPQLRAATLACAGGAGLGWAATAAVALQAWGAVHALTVAALWISCGGVFASATHRMLPLDAMADQPRLAARHPQWLLAAMLLALGLQALDALAAAVAWPLPVAWQAAQALAAAGAAALLGRIAWRWARRQRLGAQLTAMLHVGLVWLVVALALQATSHAQAALGRPGALDLAPLHALALGWMGSTLFAMASRVAGAFGGQPKAADAIAWRLFALVQVAALTRVAAALWPGAPSGLAVLAAAAWAAAATGWLLVYGRWLGRPPRAPDAGAAARQRDGG